MSRPFWHSYLKKPLRRFLATGLALGFISILGGGLLTKSEAATPQPRQSHGVSLFGSLRYGKDFKHYDYVNPKAPKGGRLHYAALGSFDSLNPFIVKGNSVAGVGLIYDTLMTDSLDEPASQYGLIAETVEIPDDLSYIIFTLRPSAKWHDGKRITPEDVIWTFETLKNNLPFYKAYYADVTKVEKLDPLRVRFSFGVFGNKELPYIVGQLPVLPRHYWDKRNKDHDISKTVLKPPLGSGAYRMMSVQPGRSIIYQRVKDYWGNNLPVNRGTNNFDSIKIDYFGDTTVALEAFRAGKLNFRFEDSAKNWATAYQGEAVKSGRIVLESLKVETPLTMQGFVLNTRRKVFSDRRVRQAFNLAFDFEWLNENLLYNQYQRTHSYFQNSELAATGLPSAQELKLLNPWRKNLPAQLFQEPYQNPKTDGSGNNRAYMRTAAKLLDEAGYVLRDGQRFSKDTGKPLQVVFLLVQPSFKRFVQPYIRNLKKLGIAARLRLVDSSQYQNLLNEYDFDIVVGNVRQSLSPGNEQRDFWGSASAQRSGGRNLAGINNPVVDALIDAVIFAKDRQALITATRALDRVLLWQYYHVPQWHIDVRRIARSKNIVHPDKMPPYSIGFPAIWWDATPTP